MSWWRLKPAASGLRFVSRLMFPNDLCRRRWRMELGETVIYQGRRYVVRGFSTVGPHVVIEDAETRQLLSVPLEEVEPEPEPPVAT